MTNKWHQFKAGLRYFLFAKHRRGYNIHSPFVYNFIRSVLLKSTKKSFSGAIKDEFKKIALETKGKIENNGLGAGTNNIFTSSSMLKLSRTSGTPDKYLSLLNQIIKHYDIRSFLELGTCCGVTTAALAKSNEELEITTIEGSEVRFQISNQLFKNLKIFNVNAIHSEFQSELKQLLGNNSKFDLIFIDGDHSYAATIENYQQVVSLCSEQGVIIIDDIYWSAGMTKAWREIISDERAKVTVDLFRMGIIFLGRNQAKQSFTVRY